MKEWLVPLLAVLLGGGGAGGLTVLIRFRTDRAGVLIDSASKVVLLQERDLERVRRERDQALAELDTLRAEFDTYRRQHP